MDEVDVSDKPRKFLVYVNKGVVGAKNESVIIDVNPGEDANEVCADALDELISSVLDTGWCEADEADIKRLGLAHTRPCLAPGCSALGGCVVRAAKFPGTCVLCRARFQAGAQIHYTKASGAEHLAWLLVYNGRDGDCWAWSNCGGYIASRFLLTDEARALLTDLGALPGGS